MALVRLSRPAEIDFNTILDDLELRAGRAVAQRYHDSLLATFEQIADHPGIGSPRPRLGRDTRLMVVHPYLVYYDGELTSETALVLRIIHGRRRIERRLIDQGRTE